MNKERRKFIKTACLCGGFLLVGRFIGSIFPGFLKNSSDNSTLLSQKRDDKSKKSTFYDNEGNKVLIIEK